MTDADWVDSSAQVGLNGQSRSADLYIAVGTGGASQHLAGVTSVGTVVAVNADPAAEIFRRARFGVVGDYLNVVPAPTRRLRQFQGTGQST